MKNALLACTLALPLLLACAGGSSSQNRPSRAERPERPALVEKKLSEAELAKLQELEQLYRKGHVSYVAVRNEAMREMPKLGPWLAKAMTVDAVKGHDDLMRRGFAPRPEDFEKSMHPFYRAARELADLGIVGGQAVRIYLLQDRRSAVRRVGLQLLDAFDYDTRMELLENEWSVAKSTAQRRTVLEGLAGMEGERAGKLLAKACQHGEWEVRGTALPVYARWAKAAGEAETAAAVQLFWRLHEEDPDAFVRRMALEAIGETGDAAQVRKLVDALEKAMNSSDARASESAANALRALTRKRFGTKVRAWRAWLGDQ